ncbi:hypothetical protein NOSIN_21040 [Nocardiopsis sinuspersici]|uniref:Catalase core domain-containing protein n=1 Tax=Nocardiopsis sinuspersici TaxID=501010 RepID=A0A1V3C5P3_9ACTN|nr:hypothetical protein NOSIN_21040 [Nocardiopsis sinuspersici]
MSASYSTDDAGIPMPHDGLSRSVGPNGPLLLQDHFLLQKMAHSNRERVPERVVHAKGGGVARGLGVRSRRRPPPTCARHGDGARPGDPPAGFPRSRPGSSLIGL